jgi:menaquinone-dependent protoporphyrinogen IX oxidase
MRSIVIYYSRKGSNKYLAEKIAGKLSCDMEEIRPRSNSFSLILTNINSGIRKLSHDISSYDRVIMVGPVFMGRFIPPLKSFVMKYKDQISQLVFVTCCGSSYDKKDEKFGHGHVFQEVEKILGDKLVRTQAFPVGLVLPEEQREDPDAFMKTHLNESNFTGEIQDRFEELVKELA